MISHDKVFHYLCLLYLEYAPSGNHFRGEGTEGLGGAHRPRHGGWVVAIEGFRGLRGLGL